MGKGDRKTRKGKRFIGSRKKRTKRNCYGIIPIIQKRIMNYKDKKETSSNICYLCGYPMDIGGNCVSHEEHVIQNALYGRLRPSNILCQNCGNELSRTIDAPFVEIFDSITERFKHILISKDHGKDKSKSLKGYLYKFENVDEKIPIISKDGKIVPINPFYELSDNDSKVTIYADSSRAKHYKSVVEKELKEKGLDSDKIIFEYKDDIKEKGILGIFFTEGIKDFNSKFKKGLAKIAVGFASSCGISRESMKCSLEISKITNKASINGSHVLPYIPIGAVDRLVEANRPEIEDKYPTHTLILFNEKVSDEENYLFCYADLFSTFQYYIILDNNYNGNDIYKTYHQTVIKQELPERITDIDVRRTKPKHLMIITDALGIDMSKTRDMNYEETLDYIEKQIKDFRATPKLTLEEELELMYGKLQYSIALGLTDKSIDRKNFDEFTLKINSQMANMSRIELISEMYHFFHKNGEDKFNDEMFRKFFFDKEGKITLSTPIECFDSTISNWDRRAYCHLKFNQLNDFVQTIENKKTV